LIILIIAGKVSQIENKPSTKTSNNVLAVHPTQN